MATQRELVNAFVNGENQPSRASNMRLIHGDDGIVDYVTGGRGGTEVVIAEKEPMEQYTVHRGYVRSRMTYGFLRSQQNTVYRQIRRRVRNDERFNGVEYPDVITDEHSSPPQVSDVNNITA